MSLGSWATLIRRQRQLRVEPVGWLREHLEGRGELPAIEPDLQLLLETGELHLEGVCTLRVHRRPARTCFDPALLIDISVPERRRLVAEAVPGFFHD
mgnify:CR=1 FL=1